MRDYAFLERCFHKLLMNFTWWVNRKDSEQNNIFEGGFLASTTSASSTAARLSRPAACSSSPMVRRGWRMYCLAMLRIALELAIENPNYEDIASKFFEHFLYIANAINREGGHRAVGRRRRFYYDRLKLPDGTDRRIRIRSLVGLVPLFACDTIEPHQIDALPRLSQARRVVYRTSS